METEALEVASTSDGSLLSVINRAIMSPKFDVTKLQQLLEVKERWEKNEARKLFVIAMSDFKANAITVVKDKVNTQFQSKYVSLGKLIGTVTPFLSKHGLSSRWEIDQSLAPVNGIKVTCIMTHIAGHSEQVSMVVPPDASGVSHKTGESTKNPIQQIKSAITYAKACTFESICGLASTDANIDDDGNSAEGIQDDRLSEHIEWLANAHTLDELKRLFKNAYVEAEQAKDKLAMSKYIAAKNKRKAELQ